MSDAAASTSRVLVVDDDRVARAILTRALEREGYVVEQAVDGVDAVERIDASIPDLVLLDVTMPRMSGLEVLHLVRQRFGALDLPVVMTSARSEVDDVLAALHLGANDYVTKPVDFGLLVRRVAAILGHRAVARDRMLLSRRLDLVVEASALMVSMHGPDGRFLQASSALSQYLGRNQDELADVALHDLLHPEDATGVAKHTANLPDAYSLVARIHRGERFGWAEIEHQALRDGVTHEVLAVQAIWRDRDALTSLAASPSAPVSTGEVARRSFAFTPAPAMRRLAAAGREYGPAVDVDTTPIPWPRSDTLPPTFAPGIEAEALPVAPAQLRQPPGGSTEPT